MVLQFSIRHPSANDMASALSLADNYYQLVKSNTSKKLKGDSQS